MHLVSSADRIYKAQLFGVYHLPLSPLLFHPGGEQGMDMGGLQKEFFQIIIDTVFNPDYGMFHPSQASSFFQAYYGILHISINVPDISIKAIHRHY